MSKLGVIGFLFGFLIDLVNSDSYCWYVHDEYDTVEQKYCRTGCCRDSGDDDEICCFEWTIGVIIGICFAAVIILTVIVIIILCCYTVNKKRNRTGTTIDSAGGGTNVTNTVIYSAASGYSYPHPPSAFYPSSQFPNEPPAYGPPPKYGMYPPPPDSGQSESSFPSPPPSYTTPSGPAYPPSQQNGVFGAGFS